MLVIECPQSIFVPKEELKLNASHAIEASLMLFFVAVVVVIAIVYGPL